MARRLSAAVCDIPDIGIRDQVAIHCESKHGSAAINIPGRDAVISVLLAAGLYVVNQAQPPGIENFSPPSVTFLLLLCIFRAMSDKNPLHTPPRFT